MIEMVDDPVPFLFGGGGGCVHEFKLIYNVMYTIFNLRLRMQIK